MQAVEASETRIMNTITIQLNKKFQSRISTQGKVALSYLAAHLTALSTVIIMYISGLFDVGFLSNESLLVQIAHHLI